MEFLGIDLDGNIKNLAWIDKQKKIIKLCTYPSNVKPLYKPDLKKVKKTFIVTGLNAKQVLIKQKTLKVKSKKGVKKTIPFQIKSSTILPPDQNIVLPFVTRSDKASSEISFYITTKQAINNHLAELNNEKICPDYLSFQSQALNRFAELHFPAVKELFLLHIGNKKTVVAYVKNRFVKAHYLIKIGAANFFPASGKEESCNQEIDLSALASPAASKLKEIADLFKNELSKAFLSFIKNSDTQKIPIFFSGQINLLPDLARFILPDNLEILSEELKIKDTHLLPYAISIGLGLDGKIKDQKSVQFLQEEFVPRRHLKKAGLSLMLILALSFILSATFSLASDAISKRKERILSDTLSILEKEEKSFADPSASFEERMKNLDTKVKNDLKISSHISLAPKVSEVLQWISTHPLIESKDSINISSLTYEIIDMSDEPSSKQSCCAKVSLNLKISDPVYAQKFYESLSAYPNFIDTAKDLSWTEKNSKHTLSFFLKNLTPSEFYDRQN